MVDDFFDSISPEGAYSIGESMGRYKTTAEAIRAFDMGEIELWIAYVTPKTMEEWDEWVEEHGEGFENRWKV